MILPAMPIENRIIKVQKRNQGQPGVALAMRRRYGFAMSIQEIEKAVQGMPRSQVEELQSWIQDYLEDQQELTEGFKASIERGRQDIAQGRVRVRQS